MATGYGIEFLGNSVLKVTFAIVFVLFLDGVVVSYWAVSQEVRSSNPRQGRNLVPESLWRLK